MNGILLINKEKNCTSRDVVNEVCKIFNTKKVGHTGTLDPLATGVLVICIGSTTKLVEILTSKDKEYEALIMLGIETDTLDITGNILKEEKCNINEVKIKETLKKMTKTYLQEVPIYSAVKVKGKKLYEYAREDKKVELPKREVIIKSLELVGNVKYIDNKTYFKIKTTVSKGTYIRSLIRDIAHELNTSGVMVELKRTAQGEFSINDCYTIDELKKGNYKLLDIDIALEKYTKIKVDSYLEEKIKNGCILENRYKQKEILFINQNNVPLALYKIYEKDNTKIKPWKMFKNI